MLLQKRILTLALILAGFFTLPTLSVAGDITVPIVPKAAKKADEKTLCIRPVEDMRVNHMDYLLHKRDDTMYKGIRTKKDSIAECIDCHVAPDSKGVYASFGEDKHFCSACHNYASVQIDCFECHRDKPRDVNYKHSLVDKSRFGKKYHHNSITSEHKNKQIDVDTLDALKQMADKSETTSSSFAHSGEEN